MSTLRLVGVCGRLSGGDCLKGFRFNFDGASNSNKNPQGGMLKLCLGFSILPNKIRQKTSPLSY